MNDTKFCNKCGRTLPIDKFRTRHRGEKIYLRSWCIECENKLGKQWRENNKPYIQKYGSSEKVKERNRINKRWKKMNNPKMCWCEKTLETHRYRSRCIIYFTKEDLYNFILDKETCNVCGCELNWLNEKVAKNSPSLDRINNESFLNLNNIQLLCHSCNSTKRDRTMDEFIEYCRLVVEKHG